jgi:DNA-binding transcriptional LysR family regulator
MATDDLSALSMFLTVAEERSFTKAAKRLGITPSAVSHAMRDLEEEIGVRLLSRTTRSVAPTVPGEHLLRRVQPAFTEIREAVGQVSRSRNKPAGRVRLLAPRLAVKTVLAPTIGRFVRDYPDITLEVTTDDSRMDIVAGGFDAGIHFGEYIEKDMIAVRVSPDESHRCINFRHGSAGVYRWEFEKGRKSLSVAVNGPLIVDDLELVISAAVDGIGLAYMSEEHGAEQLASGALVKVLEDWCQPYPGFFLYYPSRRNQPAALAALINTLRITE